MNTQKVRLILHVGQHKTGSKALQSFLAHNTKQLLKKEVLYPISQSNQEVKAYRNSHFNCYVLARREAYLNEGNEHVVDDFWRAHQYYCKPFLSLNELFSSFELERVKCGAHTIVLSAEDLFDMQTAHNLDFSFQSIECAVERLFEAILKMNWVPEIVVYLRRPDQLLNSHYAQYIKGDEINTLDFESFFEKFKPRLNSLAILKIWSKVFGRDAIHVLPYERESLPEGIVVNFFEQIFGFLPSDEWVQVPQDSEFFNHTPRRAYIDFLRVLNLRKSRGLITLPREIILSVAFNQQSENCNKTGWVNDQLRNALLKQYQQNFLEITENYHRSKYLHSSFFKEGWNALPANTSFAKSDFANEDKFSLQEKVALIISMLRHICLKHRIKITCITIIFVSVIYWFLSFLIE